MYKYTRIEIKSGDREIEIQKRRYSENICLCVYVCSVFYNIIFSFCLRTSPSWPTSLLSVALFPSIRFTVMGCSFFFIILPFTCCCVDQKITHTVDFKMHAPGIREPRQTVLETINRGKYLTDSEVIFHRESVWLRMHGWLEKMKIKQHTFCSRPWTPTHFWCPNTHIDPFEGSTARRRSHPRGDGPSSFFQETFDFLTV